MGYCVVKTLRFCVWKATKPKFVQSLCPQLFFSGFQSGGLSKCQQFVKNCPKSNVVQLTDGVASPHAKRRPFISAIANGHAINLRFWKEPLQIKAVEGFPRSP